MRAKRRVRVASVVVMVLAIESVWMSSPASGVAGFGDVGGDRFYTKAVQWMVDNDITTGTSATCFSPEDPVTRGQAAAFMWRMEGEPAAPAHPFTDVVKDWQQGPVSWMAHTGITTGTAATTYSPEDVVTRGQMAALLWRLEGEPAAPPHPFVDVSRDWQQGPVSWMAATGVTTGTTGTTFSPEATVTRGQLATFFHRYKGEPPVVVDPTHPTDPACAQQVPGPHELVSEPLSTAMIVSSAGFGPIKVGMSVDEAMNATSTPLVFDAEAYADLGSQCSWLEPVGFPGVLFQVWGPPDGLYVATVYVENAAIKTPSGIHVGATAEDVHRAFPGRIRTQPHEYVETRLYLDYVANDPSSGSVRFEVDGQTNRVDRIQAGLGFELVEGCA